jgi:Brp/Blh family beta-carotene 15,15'-monooxygenase
MRRFFFIELITIILMILLFNFTSLILAFGSYFVLWHSFPSMKDQIKYLYGSYNFKNILFYVKASLLYWIASILSLIFVKIYFTIPESFLIPLFFSFMAAITFPHVLVIGRIKGSI